MTFALLPEDESDLLHEDKTTMPAPTRASIALEDGIVIMRWLFIMMESDQITAPEFITGTLNLC